MSAKFTGSYFILLGACQSNWLILLKQLNWVNKFSLLKQAILFFKLYLLCLTFEYLFVNIGACQQEHAPKDTH